MKILLTNCTPGVYPPHDERGEVLTLSKIGEDTDVDVMHARCALKVVALLCAFVYVSKGIIERQNLIRESRHIVAQCTC